MREEVNGGAVNCPVDGIFPSHFRNISFPTLIPFKTHTFIAPTMTGRRTFTFEGKNLAAR